MANKITVDNQGRVAKDKVYILEERILIIFERLHKGFDKADIARMLNVDKSVITRTIQNNYVAYKKWVFMNSK
jgi:DNA-binding NarL/FixJ family response regulator